MIGLAKENPTNIGSAAVLQGLGDRHHPGRGVSIFLRLCDCFVGELRWDKYPQPSRTQERKEGTYKEAVRSPHLRRVNSTISYTGRQAGN